MRPQITRSWRDRSRRSARRPGRGAAGGSSVDPDTVSSAGLPLLPLQATQLDQDGALLQSARSTIICSRSAYCLRLLHAYRRMHPPDAATSATRLSPRLEAAQHLLKRSSRHPHACCACPSAARKAAPRHACRRTTLLRVICANAASRLLRLYLSAYGARQAAPLLACRRAPHLRVHSIDPVAIATSALSNSLAVSYSNSTLHVEHMSFKPISFPS